jgi:LCP family protein required for cell wall assembly
MRVLLPLALVLSILAGYLLAPLRTTVLLLGVDGYHGGPGRTDTMILLTVVPLRPNVGTLSIPRDLWLNIPGVGENRINTAYHFAELDQPGSGPQAAKLTVEQNFGIGVPYYASIRFEGLRDFVDALGGVPIELAQPTAGLGAGLHVLDGKQALAFVRSRAGSDDIHRMQNGQLFIKALLRHLLQPSTWPRLPAALMVLRPWVATDLPLWEWPRLGLALLRAGSAGIESRTIDWNMVRPFTTSRGAQVLEPLWERINPLLNEMFGR